MRRFLRLAGIAAGVATVVTCSGVAPASAHTQDHSVVISGVTDIVPAIGWGQDVVYPFNGKVVVGPERPVGSFRATACEGGTRADFEVRVQDVASPLAAGSIRATATVRLYVGETCATAVVKSTAVVNSVIKANDSWAGVIRIHAQDSLAAATLPFDIRNNTTV